MIRPGLAALRRSLVLATPLALALTLPACDGDGGGMDPPVAVAPTPTPTPAPTPTPTPTPSPTSRNVTACLNQVIPGTGGMTPTSLVLPDTIKLDFSRPAGFPNGRRLPDPVVDITLAVLFLDVNATGQSAATLANVPVNPPANDLPFLANFPYVAAPQGAPPMAAGTGASFNFRTDPASSFVRVDRNGGPAVAPALIGATLKNPYNDGNLQDDINGAYVGGTDGIVNQLVLLHNALADDLIALGLRVCST
ncbi:MAG: DUF4331 family protein [Novosphingobium sp.]|nr:DUF4331 family protein [Novosphingobium sp.]